MPIAYEIFKNGKSQGKRLFPESAKQLSEAIRDPGCSIEIKTVEVTDDEVTTISLTEPGKGVFGGGAGPGRGSGLGF